MAKRLPGRLKKIGGVLCEALGEEYFHLSVVGIGLNVNIPLHELLPFQSNPFSATSFPSKRLAGFSSWIRFSACCSASFSVFTALYHEEGFREIQTIWEKNCAFIGKRVELRESGWRNSEQPA